MSLRRRAFLKALAAVGAGAAQGLPALARGAGRPDWALAFDGVTQDLPPLDMQLRGRIPEACRGTLYRNGPARFERGGQRYGHWIDPDGMVQAFHLSDAGVSHRGRFVRTDKFRREEAAGRFLYDGAGSLLADTLAPGSNESMNVANTSLQPLGGELLALWEAGGPYRLDPQTLETRGRLAFSDELDGVPFSAHPHVDEAGDLWNIGSVPFATQPTLLLYHVGAGGELMKWRAHTLDFAGYMHDFLLTPRYLLALNSSAVSGSGETFVDSLHCADRAVYGA